MWINRSFSLVRMTPVGAGKNLELNIARLRE